MWIFWTIVLVVIGAALAVYSWTSDGLHGVAGMLSSMFIVSAIEILNVHIEEPIPTAIDVYRGNTELEITSVNGVPTDTVVVFKNN